jgi:hypothetical protein
VILHAQTHRKTGFRFGRIEAKVDLVGGLPYGTLVRKRGWGVGYKFRLL